jgi:hypothetical protein
MLGPIQPTAKAFSLVCTVPLLAYCSKLLENSPVDDRASQAAYIDHELVLMRVSEKEVRNHMWAVPVDNLVEQICGVWKWVGSIPSC